jgi:hypothetical protein
MNPQQFVRSGVVLDEDRRVRRLERLGSVEAQERALPVVEAVATGDGCVCRSWCSTSIGVGFLGPVAVFAHPAGLL